MAEMPQGCDQEILESKKADESNSAGPEDRAPKPAAHTSVPQHEWQQPLNRADSIGLLVGLVGTYLALIVPTVWQKIPALALICFGSAYLIWLSHWTQHIEKRWRIIAIALLLLVINVGSVPQLIEQWKIEHMHSELTFNASAPGVAYPDGDHYGIKWLKGFAEVRLTVTSGAQFPIQNLNISVWTTDKTFTIGGMAQVDQQQPPGCVVRRPRDELASPPVILQGQDGTKVDLAPFANDQMSELWPFRDHYDLLCQRILAGESIPLVVAAAKMSGGMVAPPQLHISGDYETTAPEGNKRVKVDELVSISRP